MGKTVLRAIAALAGAVLVLLAAARAVAIADGRALGSALPGLLMRTYAVRGKAGIRRFDAKR